MENTLVVKKEKIVNLLRRIANVLILNAGFTDNPGLINGKMGISLFFYLYGRQTDKSEYSDFAGELIDQIYEDINSSTPVDFANGLSGIGWGIGYLVKSGFVEADIDEALAEIDNTLYRSFYSNPVLLDNGSDLFGYGHYFISRLHHTGQDEENLNNLIRKEHLIYLIDECERLLVHKRYLEFNILQLRVSAINSLLWFLLETDKLEMFPSKVRKILNYLPDYISNESQVNNSGADWRLLQNLSEKASAQFDGDGMKQKYRSLQDRAVVEIKSRNGNGNEILDDMQEMQLHKLIYGQYCSSPTINHKSYETVLRVLNNEGELNARIKSINKSNLGLSGLSGTGLLLLQAAKVDSEESSGSINLWTM
jgi:hypothetical protein